MSTAEEYLSRQTSSRSSITEIRRVSFNHIPSKPHFKSSRFSEELVRHGFYKETSMQAATKAKFSETVLNQKKIKLMSKVNDEFDKEMKLVLKLQSKVSRMQMSLACSIQREYSSIAIQMCFRCHRARVRLRELKLYRYVSSRWRFYVWYKTRRRSAKLLFRTMRTYVLRKSFLAILPFLRALRVIQRKYRSIKAIREAKRLLAVKIMARRTSTHCLLFGLTRAVAKIRTNQRSPHDLVLSNMALQFLRRYVRRRRIRYLRSVRGKIAYYWLSRVDADTDREQAGSAVNGSDISNMNSSNRNMIYDFIQSKVLAAHSVFAKTRRRQGHGVASSVIENKKSSRVALAEADTSMLSNAGKSSLVDLLGKDAALKPQSNARKATVSSMGRAAGVSSIAHDLGNESLQLQPTTGRVGSQCFLDPQKQLSGVKYEVLPAERPKELFDTKRPLSLYDTVAIIRDMLRMAMAYKSLVDGEVPEQLLVPVPGSGPVASASTRRRKGVVIKKVVASSLRTWGKTGARGGNITTGGMGSFSGSLSGSFSSGNNNLAISTATAYAAVAAASVSAAINDGDKRAGESSFKVGFGSSLRRGSHHAEQLSKDYRRALSGSPPHRYSPVDAPEAQPKANRQDRAFSSHDSGEDNSSTPKGSLRIMSELASRSDDSSLKVMVGGDAAAAAAAAAASVVVIGSTVSGTVTMASTMTPVAAAQRQEPAMAKSHAAPSPAPSTVLMSASSKRTSAVNRQPSQPITPLKSKALTPTASPRQLKVEVVSKARAARGAEVDENSISSANNKIRSTSSKHVAFSEIVEKRKIPESENDITDYISKLDIANLGMMAVFGNSAGTVDFISRIDSPDFVSAAAVFGASSDTMDSSGSHPVEQQEGQIERPPGNGRDTEATATATSAATSTATAVTMTAAAVTDRSRSIQPSFYDDGTSTTSGTEAAYGTISPDSAQPIAHATLGSSYSTATTDEAVNRRGSKILPPITIKRRESNGGHRVDAANIQRFSEAITTMGLPEPSSHDDNDDDKSCSTTLSDNTGSHNSSQISDCDSINEPASAMLMRMSLMGRQATTAGGLAASGFQPHPPSNAHPRSSSSSSSSNNNARKTTTRQRGIVQLKPSF